MTNSVAIIYTEEYSGHDTGAHVESPERGPAIKDALEQAPFAGALEWVAPRQASVQQIAGIHDSSYINFVKKSCDGAGRGMRHLNPDTAICARSYDVALLAAGGVLEGIDRVLDGRNAHFFAVVRPPGHHAEYSESLGFCLFNNIAIGARYAIEEKGLDRVFILDWDVHHGNGTQHSLESDPTVFFCSFHQCPHYPGTGRAQEYGRGDGLGYTMNFPMPAGSGNADYLHLMRDIVAPAMEKFKPQLVLVSAGFDAHSADPLSSIELTESAYADMVRIMLDAAPGAPMGLVLEGGYNLRTLASSAAAATGVLAGDDSHTGPQGDPSAAALKLAQAHREDHPFLKR
jgi:acetoin utilization deacetylase AcuC-like enzyme